jgi:NAD(P)-dependent dehydrogenase (short-subunit alcohol dehydrogenase family)
MSPPAKVALVTGAASGMGQLAAWRLAADDVRVVAIDVDREGLDRTARRAPQVEPTLLDVRDVGAFAKLVADVEQRHGGIDRLVNAAAVAPTRLLAAQPLDDIHRVMEVNYFGLVNATKAVLPGMLDRGRGDIVQFGSLAGWVPSPFFGAYSATKAAVVSFSETLAHELRDTALRIVCICPPLVDTPLLDQVAAHAPPGFDQLPRIRAEEVLDAMELALERRRLFAFPGRGTATVWRLRRLVPGFLWQRIERQGASRAGRR